MSMFRCRLLALAAPSVLLLPFCWHPTRSARAAPGPTAEASILEPLGRAYAEDHGLELLGLETGAPEWVTSENRAAWTVRLLAATAIGYAPGGKRLEAIPLGIVDEMTTIRMPRDRTPAHVVRELVIPGVSIVPARWRFEAERTIESYAVLSAAGHPLFDTLLSLPVVHGPVFDARHQ